MNVILRWSKLASVAAFAALAIGCTASGNPTVILPSPSPITSSVPASSPVSALKAQYPIDGYMPDASQQAELRVVIDDMVSGCMHTLGFDYDPLNQSPPQYYERVAKVQAEQDSRIWGISDLQAAESIGYELPKMNSDAPSGTPVSSLPPREIIALTGSVGTSNGAVAKASANSGIASGGCEAQANAELLSFGLGQPGTYDSLPTDISLQSFHAAVASTQVKTVFAKWSSCMMSRGYRYSSPFSAAASFTSTSTTSISRREIQVAVTDIGCSRKFNVQGVGFAVESAYQNQLIRHYCPQLTQLKQQLRHQINTLATLVKRYGATGRE